jgi:hypothetical protein
LFFSVFLFAPSNQSARECANFYAPIGPDLSQTSRSSCCKEILSELYMYNDKTTPNRWTAPEAIAYRTWNEHTDCWSYGVTMWEIFANGRVPYENKRTHEAIVQVYLRLLCSASRGLRDAKKAINCRVCRRGYCF